MMLDDMRNFFEKHPGASYLSFVCMILLFRIFLHWYHNEAQLVEVWDVICVLLLTAGFMAGNRRRRKNKKCKDKVEELLKDNED